MPNGPDLTALALRRTPRDVSLAPIWLLTKPHQSGKAQKPQPTPLEASVVVTRGSCLPMIQSFQRRYQNLSVLGTQRDSTSSGNTACAGPPSQVQHSTAQPSRPDSTRGGCTVPSDRNEQRMTLIVLTNYSTPSMRRTCLELGATKVVDRSTAPNTLRWRGDSPGGLPRLLNSTRTLNSETQSTSRMGIRKCRSQNRVGQFIEAVDRAHDLPSCALKRPYVDNHCYARTVGALDHHPLVD